MNDTETTPTAPEWTPSEGESAKAYSLLDLVAILWKARGTFGEAAQPGQRAPDLSFDYSGSALVPKVLTGGGVELQDGERGPVRVTRSPRYENVVWIGHVARSVASVGHASSPQELAAYLQRAYGTDPSVYLWHPVTLVEWDEVVGEPGVSFETDASGARLRIETQYTRRRCAFRVYTDDRSIDAPWRAAIAERDARLKAEREAEREREQERHIAEARATFEREQDRKRIEDGQRAERERAAEIERVMLARRAELEAQLRAEAEALVDEQRGTKPARRRSAGGDSGRAA